MTQDYDERLDALPDTFQDRLLGFEVRNPLWLDSFSSYEITICEQAVVIAESVGDAARIPWWWDLSWEDKWRFTPGLDEVITLPALQEAVNLAFSYLNMPELVPKLHGALCGMVGCRAYGCWAVEEEEYEDQDTSEEDDDRFDDWDKDEDDED